MSPCRLLPVVLSALALGAARPAPAAGQDAALRLEVRAGESVPLGPFREGPERGGPMGAAPTFALHLAYRGAGGWGPYVGFSQHRFDCADDGCPGSSYVLTPWDLGVERGLGRLAWARAGVLFGRLERPAPAGPGGAGRGTEVSALSMGAEAGLGLRVFLPGRLGLVPAVRYGWLNTRFPDGPLVRMRWLAVDLGLGLGF